jgi:signal transduction histidine kinase
LNAAIMGEVRSTVAGFQKLIGLYDQMVRHDGTTFGIDMSGVTWFDANMCAPFGAVLQHLRISGREITLYGLRPSIREILEKNGFLPNFGFNAPKRPDKYGTTIEYKRFERQQAQAFRNYVVRHFAGKGIPKMSTGLLKRFRESISEIFDNAVDHSCTTLGIFACGQLYPARRRLDFCIADRGIGICENIRRHIGLELSPESAIAWALEGENTTRLRQAGKPGGLGLKLIKEFIGLNQGQIQIVSDAGFWSFHGGTAQLRRLEAPFPGTVVNIEINTADKAMYRLKSEVDAEDIF